MIGQRVIFTDDSGCEYPARVVGDMVLEGQPGARVEWEGALPYVDQFPGSGVANVFLDELRFVEESASD